MNSFQKKILFRTSLTLVILSLSGICCYTFIQRINKVIKQTELAKQELANRSALVNQIQELEKEKLKAAPYLVALKQFLPTESEAIHFEEQLKNLALKYHLNLSFRFDTLNNKKDQANKNYSFNIVLSGNQQNILSWLQEVERLPYAFSFERLEFISQSANKDLFNVKILGHIYLR